MIWLKKLKFTFIYIFYFKIFFSIPFKKETQNGINFLLFIKLNLWKVTENYLEAYKMMVDYFLKKFDDCFLKLENKFSPFNFK